MREEVLLLVLGISAVWASMTVMVLALCVQAGRADRLQVPAEHPPLQVHRGVRPHASVAPRRGRLREVA